MQGFNRRAAVLALANTFSNTVMIGIALISLMYGPAGLVTRLTLVSVHSLIHPAPLPVIAGLPMTVMVVTMAASLPIGATVFLFSQRYQVAEELMTASVVVSSALALFTLTLVLLLDGRPS